MNWPDTLERAAFLRRENRFRAVVDLEGRPLAVHVPNSGRLTELLTPGAAVWIRRHDRPDERKTAADLALAEFAGALVSVDARLPNKLLAEALRGKLLAPFAMYDAAQAEVVAGHSRLDFRLTAADPEAGEPCWVETKSVTLVEQAVALFPDAPTERGLRHVRELVGLRRSGAGRAAVVFVIQRGDAAALTPHPTAHPAFAAGLREARRAGVELYAWRCAVDLAGISLSDPVEVRA